MQLSNGSGADGVDVENVIFDILGSRPALKAAFEEMIEMDPELLDEVIFQILEEDKISVNVDAIDHHTCVDIYGNGIFENEMLCAGKKSFLGICLAFGRMDTFLLF